MTEAYYSSHYWTREFEALGHKISHIPAQPVKPFVRGNKTDYIDAVAIIEASQRRIFFSIKMTDHQDIQHLHRIRVCLVLNREGRMNQIQGRLVEYNFNANRFKALNVINSEQPISL